MQAVALKSDIMNFETRRYYLDLKENSRGRFLRIAQANNTPRPTRSQVNSKAFECCYLLAATGSSGNRFRYRGN